MTSDQLDLPYIPKARNICNDDSHQTEKTNTAADVHNNPHHLEHIDADCTLILQNCEGCEVITMCSDKGLCKVNYLTAISLPITKSTQKQKIILRQMNKPGGEVIVKNIFAFHANRGLLHGSKFPHLRVHPISNGV